MSVLGECSVEDFLRDYWQKRPLLIRGAIPGFEGPVDEHDLAGLATETWMTSRLVFEHGGERPWEVRNGPFRDDEMRSLPDGGWSLLVHAVDHAVPEVNSLRDRFSFIPNWRTDDIMVSFAPPGSGVGPHLDNYDVFLLQGKGRKLWRIGLQPTRAEEFLPGLDLRILACPRFDAEWEVGPGDMIYLPPHFAHHGVAITPSLTYSIGFRAPNWRDAMADLVSHVFETEDPSEFYTDPSLALQDDPGQISPAALSAVTKTIRARFDDPDMMALWFGRYVTTPAYALPDTAPLQISVTEVVQRWRYSGFIFRAEGTRVSYALLDSGVALFADGVSSMHPPATLPAIVELCRATRFAYRPDHPWLVNPDCRTLFGDWLASGVLYL